MTNRADILEALAERVEKASGPDREIDVLVWAAINRLEVEWRGNALFALSYPEELMLGAIDPGKHARNFSAYSDSTRPRYTASLDAAMTLKEPADEWEISTLYNIARATVGLNRDHETAWPGHGEHKGADPVLAFLAACLRAHASILEKNRG